MNTLRSTCPHCGDTVNVDKPNPWRPFCSERCRLIDLGAWLEGSHCIPGEEAAPMLPDNQDTDEPTKH